MNPLTYLGNCNVSIESNNNNNDNKQNNYSNKYY